jgi:LPXTG-motif cell wall-anchored protein
VVENSAVRRGGILKRLMLLAAMLAMVLAVSAPAIAQVGQESDQGGESGDINQSFNVTGGSSNGNSCTPLQGTAQSGNSQGQIDVTQSDKSNADDFEFEDSGSNITSSGSLSTECKQEVNQAASAATTPKAAPAPPPPAPKAASAPPPPAPKVEAKAEAPKVAPAPLPPPAPAPAPPPAPAPAPAKAELPKTGGSGTASLFALGAGALLVGGGLLARRFIK